MVVSVDVTGSPVGAIVYLVVVGVAVLAVAIRGGHRDRSRPPG
jgi:hypothetical protein